MWPFKRKLRSTNRPHQRAFAAAQVSNLLGKWQTTIEQVDADLQAGGRALRARARDVAKNNDYAKRYLELLKTNVIGKDGIRLQARSKSGRGVLDASANTMIEQAWKEFSRFGQCDVTGTLSMVEAQRLFIASAARDGEVLVRLYPGFRNYSGFAFQFLDPDLLDENHNEDLGNNRYIRMGVEFSSSGMPIAYHLTPISNDRVRGKPSRPAQRERVLAGEMIHAFRPDYAQQSRGFTWMHAAMVELHHLAAFQEAAIIAARIGASTMGFFTEQTPEGMGPDDRGANDELLIDVEPGTFRRLPMGIGFEVFESKYPSDMVDEFIKRSLKGIASGLNVSYNSLATDPESTSYGTLRGFSIEERDNYRSQQTWVSEVFLDRVYESWLSSGLQNGTIGLPFARMAKFLEVKWQPRGWQWIDPAKDANAFETMLGNNLTSPSLICAEQGRDFEEVCQQRAADNELLKKYGLMPTPSKESVNA